MNMAFYYCDHEDYLTEAAARNVCEVCAQFQVEVLVRKWCGVL